MVEERPSDNTRVLKLRGKMRVLVVDDQRTMRQMVATLFQRLCQENAGLEIELDTSWEAEAWSEAIAESGGALVRAASLQRWGCAARAIFGVIQARFGAILLRGHAAILTGASTASSRSAVT